MMADGALALPPELEQFLQSAINTGQNLASQNAARDAITEALGVFKSASGSEIAAVDDYTKASISINNIVAGAAAKDEARKAAAKEIYHTDPLVAGSVIAENAQVMRDALGTSKQLEDAINQRKNITFFDSPLAYITSQFELPSLIEQHNQQVRKYNKAEAATKDAVNLTTATGHMVTATAEGSALALAIAKNDQLLATATSEKAKLAIAGVKNNVSGYEALAQLDDKALSQAGQEFHRRIELARFAQYMQEAPDREQMRSLRAAQLEAALGDKNTKRAAEDSLVQSYNFAAIRLGVAQLRDPAMIAQLYKSKPSVKSMVDYGYEAIAASSQVGPGEAMNASGYASLPFASNPSQMAQLLIESRAPVGNADGPKALYSKEAEKLLTNPQTASQAKQNPAAFYAAIGQGVLASAGKQLSGISVDTPNIYQAAPIVAIMEAVPNIKNSTNRFIRENILPIGGANPTGKTDPDLIIGSAIAVLKAEPGRLAEVTEGINKFFGAAVEFNDRTKEYVNYGLPPQVAYKAQIKSGSLFGSSTYDMTKDVDVKTLLMKNGIYSGSGFIGSGIGGFN